MKTTDTSLKKEETNDLTKKGEFNPTPHMKVWLDVALRLMTDNITEIETESKITAQSWYGWIKDDNFNLWFKTEWDRRLAGHGWKLDAIGFKNAKRDHKYWQDMQKRVGNLKEEKASIQVNNFIPILGGATNVQSNDSNK